MSREYLTYFAINLLKFTLMKTKRKIHFWGIVILPSKINCFILNLFNLNLLFKFVTGESFKLVNRKMLLYEILKAKLCNSKIKSWMLSFLYLLQDYREEVDSLVFHRTYTIFVFLVILFIWSVWNSGNH